MVFCNHIFVKYFSDIYGSILALGSWYILIRNFALNLFVNLQSFNTWEIQIRIISINYNTSLI